MDDDEFKDFIDKQTARNTKYSNVTSYNFFKRYFVSRGELRDVELIPPIELNKLIAHRLKEAVKSDGKFYEPDVLSTYYRSFQRYLNTKDYPVNILLDPSFSLSRKVLAAKRKEIVMAGGGNKPLATREISSEEEDILFNERYFSADNPLSLTNVIWWLVSLHFGFRARQEARQLKWGDVEYGIDTDGREFLQWNVERRTKTRSGNASEQRRTFSPIVYATEIDRRLVHYYKIFRDKRPTMALGESSPFFLQINHNGWKLGPKWYTNLPLGENKIGQILTNARKRFKFGGKKVANHSVRKTGIGRMLDSDLPETYVAQQEGMKCSDSLKSYKAPGKKHKLHISHILDRYTPSHSSSTTTKSPTTQAMVHNSSKASSSKSNILQVSQVTNIKHNSSNSPTSILSPGSFSNCTNCTFNFKFGNTEKSPPIKRRFKLLSSSDEED